ncbi:hypothetical protein CASFOL_035756 [Castilleja foliolosa]|uniref:RING-type domain-containing protein n=1 Tax=Castilleja foliolosa TaxID=1961234 RepID=A0ABD3BUS3_9LAMI
MVLLGVERRETSQDPLRAHQEMEMKMANDNFGVIKSVLESEMEKGKENQEMGVNQEMENGDSDDDDDDWEEAIEEMGDECENGIVLGGVCEINDKVGGYNKNIPPVDDVCPICFDSFTIPCRSNCGHWFCASCILQLWMFKSSIQPCKCPLCCCRIINLKPEMSSPPENGAAVEVLKKVNQYNNLYINGTIGVFHKLLALPLFMRRTFGVLIDPDGLRCIYYGMRIIGLILSLLYEKWEFEFVPTGRLGDPKNVRHGSKCPYPDVVYHRFGV